MACRGRGRRAMAGAGNGARRLVMLAVSPAPRGLRTTGFRDTADAPGTGSPARIVAAAGSAQACQHRRIGQEQNRQRRGDEHRLPGIHDPASLQRPGDRRNRSMVSPRTALGWSCTYLGGRAEPLRRDRRRHRATAPRNSSLRLDFLGPAPPSQKRTRSARPFLDSCLRLRTARIYAQHAPSAGGHAVTEAEGRGRPRP